MSSPDGARWNPQSQRWEWHPPAPQPGPQSGPQPGPQSGPQPGPQSGPQPGPLPPLPPTPPSPYGYDAWPPEPTPPPPPPPPGPGGPGGRQEWRTPLLVGLVAAVVGGGAVAAWMLLGGKDTPAPAAQPPSASAAPSGQGPGPVPSTGTGSAAPSGSPSASASPSAGPGHTVVRSDGFSVAVPTGWERSYDETGNGTFYRRPGDRSALIQIFRITESASTGSCELLRLSSQRLSDGTPAYREVFLAPVPDGACELVYEYDSAESHGRRRGMERIVPTADGTRWALLAAGPAADSTVTRTNLTAAVETFRPE
ncbi:hypothetical protein OOK31_13365 [Streptomyces sp. NBC_00249]|uniref:hypothetical protein n=1 Tax=Streptomyces sp. NBC_00249 TaxID=2975690 RepID=UPI0022524E5B|nr:hypothetical protein [Streptomyces sp. NBC_00249]MCX5194877.1 hypothetical protein [Streptomyces sp. NBC_00249]